jgi:hypothetical protein
MEKLKQHLTNIINLNQDLLPKAKLTYFNRSLKSHFQLPLFYGLPKMHKTPMFLWPVVSSTKSLLATFSIWLNYKMKDLLPLAHSFLKDSPSLVEELKHLPLPDTARILTADAKSMNTNIDATMRLATIRDFLDTNKEKLLRNFLKVHILQVPEIVMRNNIFSFADTHWLQLSVTAMGTPAACAYAMLIYGHFENTMVLLAFQETT